MGWILPSGEVTTGKVCYQYDCPDQLNANKADIYDYNNENMLIACGNSHMVMLLSKLHFHFLNKKHSCSFLLGSPILWALFWHRHSLGY